MDKSFFRNPLHLLILYFLAEAPPRIHFVSCVHIYRRKSGPSTIILSKPNMTLK